MNNSGCCNLLEKFGGYMITCFIEYIVDANKIKEFEYYAPISK